MTFDFDNNTAASHPPLTPELYLLEGNRTINEMWHYLDTTAPPFWLYAWVGGQSLARWTLDNREAFKDKFVVDFGCGTGINGIAAALCGATVWSVDEFEDSRRLTDMNAELNVVSHRLTTKSELPLDWSLVDVLLFGDMFYELPLSGFARKLGDEALSKDCRVLIGDPGREYLPRRRVERLAKYTVPNTLMLERRISMPSYAFDYIPNH